MSSPTECPEGYKLRKGYTRKFRNSIVSTGYTVRRKGKLYTAKPKIGEARIAAKCIKNRTAKGPTVFGELRKGDLIKYGYQYRLADRLRHAALKKAIKKYKALPVYHKLDAVAKLTKRTAPDASAIFSKDRDWVRAHLS
jgi:hypothetical protein